MNIAFDCDMTLNNMAYTWADWIRANVDRHFSNKKATYFSWIGDTYCGKADGYWKDPEIWLSEIKPLPGAQALIKTLVDTGHSVKIITHTPEGQSAMAKDGWIARYFPEVKDVVHTHLKHKRSKGCVFVDDNPAHVNRHVVMNPGCHGIVFNHLDRYGWAQPLLPQPNLVKLTNYQEILDYIEQL